ncbi:hypothetical protein [Streptomyces sparsogenes]|uniref:hypothetical protein n=1 Tax=Streptomyces sparsogenes TaxID=67365 RepID=UPI0033CBAB15
MHLRRKPLKYHGIAAIAVCATLAATAGCSSSGDQHADSKPSTKTSTASPPADARPLEASKLRAFLLTTSDLGSGYVQSPEKEDEASQHDDITADGCPALEKLGKQSDQMKFAVKATAEFKYAEHSELGEELYSDTPSALSSKLRAVVNAWTSCPTFTMTSGSTPISMKVSKSTPPQVGEEQYAYTTTMALPAGPQILKTVAVRQGNVGVMLTGAPALVDRHIETAVAKISPTS